MERVRLETLGADKLCWKIMVKLKFTSFGTTDSDLNSKKHHQIAVWNKVEFIAYLVTRESHVTQSKT